MDIYPPIQNKYYRWYMNICHSRQLLNRIKIKGDGLTNHHIIPDSFYIESKRKSKNGWLEGNPDNLSNKVLLTQKEHFIVHHLLCFCYDGTAKRKVINAFQRMTNSKRNSKFYQIAMKLFIEGISGKNSHHCVEYILTICNNCQIEYLVIPSRYNKSKFCSNKCYREFNIGKQHPKYNKFEKNCSYCNNQFFVIQSYKISKKFCSKQCYTNFQRSLKK